MKKLTAGLLVGLLLCSPALAETYAVSTDANVSLLLNDAGEALTDAGDYSSIYSVSVGGGAAEKTYYAATDGASAGTGEDGFDTAGSYLLALLDDEGDRLTGFDYWSLTHFPKYDAIICQREDNGSYFSGALNAEGDEVIPMEYGALTPVSKDGYLGVYREDDGKNHIVYVDQSNLRTDTGITVGENYSLGNQADELVLFTDYDDSYNPDSFYLDASGAKAFDASFGTANVFISGCAVVTPKDDLEHFGLIDKTGSYLLQPVLSTLSVVTLGDQTRIFAAGSADELRSAGIAEEALSSIGSAALAYAVLDEQCGVVLAAADETAGWYSAYANGTDVLNVEFATANSSDWSVRSYAPDGTLISENNSSERTLSFNYERQEGTPSIGVLTSGVWPNQQSVLCDLQLNPIGTEYQSIEAASWKDGAGRYIVSNFTVSPTGEAEDASVTFDSWQSGICDETGKLLVDVKYASIYPLGLDRYWATETADHDGLITTTYSLIDGEGKVYYTTSSDAMFAQDGMTSPADGARDGN